MLLSLLPVVSVKIPCQLKINNDNLLDKVTACHLQWGLTPPPAELGVLHCSRQWAGADSVGVRNILYRCVEGVGWVS